MYQLLLELTEIARRLSRDLRVHQLQPQAAFRRR